MTHPLQPSAPVLPPAVVQRIDGVCNQFEAAWKAGQRPRIEDYLQESRGEERTALLYHLLALELDYRSRRGERPAWEEYRVRFPQDSRVIDSVFPCVPCPNPACGVALRISQSDRGGPIVCRACGTRFTAGEGEAATASQDTETDPGPAGGVRATGQLPRHLGRFQVRRQLGAGAFGAVYLAFDPSLEREVALKVPHAGALQSDTERTWFLREARAAAKLQHPHIVRVYEAGREEGEVYIASEFIAGPTLRDWLQDHRPDSREAARLCAQLAEALHHAHEAGVVHRDVKPSNVLMDQQDNPHVTDFGLAKRDLGEATIAREGQVLGTLAYMPPEQARGDAHHADRRADVYSLGVILYEMLAGERPFRGDSRVLVQQILHDPPMPPRRHNRRVPRELETVCLKCLEKDPGTAVSIGR